MTKVPYHCDLTLNFFAFSSSCNANLLPPPPHTLSHDRVLEAVTVNGETCCINRFDPVLQALKKTINPMLQLSCLQFINAIVNTPDDIDFKLHLRNEFMRGGLEDVLVVSVCVCGGEEC